MNALPKVYRKEIGHAKEYFKSGIEISELGLGCMSLGTEYAEPIIEKQSKVVSLILVDIYDRGTNEKLWQSF